MPTAGTLPALCFAFRTLTVDLKSITPLILTYDEAPNIARTLEKLVWANRIVVIDSGSTDDTLAILHSYPMVELFSRPFDDHASQWNFGLSKVDTDWVLALDADYQLSDELIVELHDLTPTKRILGYSVRFGYRIFGSPLRGTLYPAHTVLYRTLHAEYRNEGHTQRLVIEGEIDHLSGRIFHDDRKPVGRWFTSQQRYAKLEADYLLSRDESELRNRDRIRLMAWPAPIFVFLDTLFIRGCLFDGWPGWLYVLQRTLAEIMIAIEIIDRRLRADTR
jgi:glycosyltransferase involved in cell wall biosynthesis